MNVIKKVKFTEEEMDAVREVCAMANRLDDELKYGVDDAVSLFLAMARDGKNEVDIS